MPEVASQTVLAPDTKSTTVTIDVQKDQSSDIVGRVSKSLAEPKPEPSQDKVSFNMNDIEKITDPIAKKYAEDAYKSFQADYTKKMQEIASTRKDLEALKQRQEQDSRQPWTPDRIKSLLSDPTFVQSAQQVTNESNGQLTDDEWSALTPSEKQELKKRDLMLQSVMGELNSIKTQAEDDKLKQKYANYNPESISRFQMDLIEGKYHATREDISKVVKFEDSVRQAY
jgi:hypothetical protein